MAEEIEPQDAGVALEGPMPVLENRDSWVVDGLELTENSSLALLRGAADYLGLGIGGSNKNPIESLEPEGSTA